METAVEFEVDGVRIFELRGMEERVDRSYCREENGETVASSLVLLSATSRFEY